LNSHSQSVRWYSSALARHERRHRFDCRNSIPPLGPLDAIRLGDLLPGDMVTAVCGKRSHQAGVPIASLQGRRPGYTRLLDLERRLRCTGCGTRGVCQVEIRRP
jgi:hypothetical protein